MGSFVPKVFTTASLTLVTSSSDNPISLRKLFISFAGAVSSLSIVSSAVTVSVTPLASVTSNLNSVSNIRLAASIDLLASCPCIYVFKVAPLDGSYALIRSNKPRLPISISLWSNSKSKPGTSLYLFVSLVVSGL